LRSLREGLAAGKVGDFADFPAEIRALFFGAKRNVIGKVLRPPRRASKPEHVPDRRNDLEDAMLIFQGLGRIVDEDYFIQFEHDLNLRECALQQALE
jgi:hypothetical protein